MLVQKGTIVTIYGPYMETGVITYLHEDINVDNYNPDTHEMYLDYLPEFHMSTFTIYYGNYRYYSIPTDETREIVVTTTLFPVIPSNISLDTVYNSTIIMGDKIMPSMNLNDDIIPITISSGLSQCLTSYENDGYMISLDEYEGDLSSIIEELIYMYDSGYLFNRYCYDVSSNVYRQIYTNVDLLYRFPMMVYKTGFFYKEMLSIKNRANNLLNDDTDIEYIHKFLHLVPDYTKWFFVPDGYHLARYRTDYDFLIRRKSIHIHPMSEYTSLILSMVNINPYMKIKGAYANSEFSSEYYEDSTYTSTYGSLEMRYDIPEEIANALRIINKDKLHVLLAGGFVITKGDYDFFILGGSTIVARQMMELLNVVSCTVTTGVLTSERYQFILCSDLHNELDVLYSFDLSHCMVAHNGKEFICTPEFLTFSNANLSLLVLPVTRMSRVNKVIDLGMSIVHNHAKYLQIDDYDKEYTPLVSIDEAMGQVVSKELAFITTNYSSHDRTVRSSSIVLGSSIDSNSPHISMYLNINGNNEGWYPIIDDKRYYVEISNNNITLIRELV